MTTANYVWIVLIVVGIIAIGAITEIFRTRCPSCRKFWARKIQRTDRQYETDWDMKGTHQHVNSTHYCKCKYCGYEWNQRYRSTKSNR